MKGSTDKFTFPPHINLSNVCLHVPSCDELHPSNCASMALKAQTLFLLSLDARWRAPPISNINSLCWQHFQRQPSSYQLHHSCPDFHLEEQKLERIALQGWPWHTPTCQTAKTFFFLFNSPVGACKPESWSGTTEGIHLIRFLFWILSTWMWKSQRHFILMVLIMLTGWDLYCKHNIILAEPAK